METQNMWYACVQYGDRKKELVRVKRIKDFKPKSVTDFDGFQPYECKTNLWSHCRKAELYDCIIEGLGVDQDGAAASRKENLKKQSQADKEKLKCILCKLSREPKVASDISASEAGEALNNFEKQDEKKRQALREARTDIGNSLIARVESKIPRSTSTQRVNRQSVHGNKSNGRRRIPPTELDLVQRKRLQKQEKEKENAACEWGDKVFEAQTQKNQNQSPSCSINQQAMTNASHPTPTSEEPSLNTQETHHRTEAPSPSTSHPILKLSHPQSVALSFWEDIKFPESPCPEGPASEWLKLVVESCVKAVTIKHEETLKNLAEDIKTMKDSLNSIQSNMNAFIEGNIQSNENTLQNGVKILFEKVVTAGKVDLGQGFLCSDIGWKGMNTSQTITDWCLAILRGTFGEDKAMRFRVKTGYADLSSFPRGFVTVAEGYYKNFLSRRITELQQLLDSYGASSKISEEEELLINDLSDKDLQVQHPIVHAKRNFKFFKDNELVLATQLGAQLSDRCDSMYRQWRRREKQRGIELPPRTRRNQNKQPGSKTTAPKTPKAKLLTMPKYKSKSRGKTDKAPENREAASPVTVHLDGGKGNGAGVSCHTSTQSPANAPVTLKTSSVKDAHDNHISVPSLPTPVSCNNAAVEIEAEMSDHTPQHSTSETLRNSTVKNPESCENSKSAPFLNQITPKSLRCSDPIGGTKRKQASTGHVQSPEKILCRSQEPSLSLPQSCQKTNTVDTDERLIDMNQDHSPKSTIRSNFGLRRLARGRTGRRSKSGSSSSDSDSDSNDASVSASPDSKRSWSPCSSSRVSSIDSPTHIIEDSDEEQADQPEEVLPQAPTLAIAVSMTASDAEMLDVSALTNVVYKSL